jgi:hypothetical protein
MILSCAQDVGLASMSQGYPRLYPTTAPGLSCALPAHQGLVNPHGVQLLRNSCLVFVAHFS